MLEDTGIVAIGRNEGDRLMQCLQSVVGKVAHVVYVDSGSTDDSVAFAEGLGCTVVELRDKFTAARARNAGFRKLLQLYPKLKFVQFVDGDCEVVPGWLDAARDRLLGLSSLVVVCGRRRERYPEASIYNLCCDIEWDTPVGETKACGGDAMMKTGSLQEVGGYRETLIAGEEPELCVRLREQGGKIERLDAEMTLHDAAMTRFSQWWRRCKRGGHAFAEGASLHGEYPERHWVREIQRTLFWGGALPLSIVTVLPLSRLLAGLLASGYVVSTVRVYYSARARDRAPLDCTKYAVLTTLGKFAEMQGASEFYINRLRGRQAQLIEYKS